jgi:hypothetical protein
MTNITLDTIPPVTLSLTPDQLIEFNSSLELFDITNMTFDTDTDIITFLTFLASPRPS